MADLVTPSPPLSLIGPTALHIKVLAYKYSTSPISLTTNTPLSSTAKTHHVRPLQTHHPLIRWSPLVHTLLPISHNIQHPTKHPLQSRKIPWRLSTPQKARQRKRLRAIDALVSTVSNALSKQGFGAKALERWHREMPVEKEMRPRDKYTIFDRKVKGYRKGIHSECAFFLGGGRGLRTGGGVLVLGWLILEGRGVRE